MSIQLKLDNVDFDQPKENHLKLQYMPASIDEATTTNIDQFFNNYTTEQDGCEYLVRIFLGWICVFMVILSRSFEKFVPWFPVERVSIQSAGVTSWHRFPRGPKTTR